MTPTSAPLDEHELLASEYALGVLEGRERAQAEALVKSSPAFAARVASWQMRLAPLAEQVDAVPAPDLFPQIEARLFGRPKRRWFTLPDGWLGGLIGTGAMAALSVVVLALLLQLGGPNTDSAAQVTTLLAKDSAVQFSARLEGAVLTVAQIKGAAAPAGRSFELWLIEGDAAPVSLGLITAELHIPAPSAAKGYVLAVTDEPFGGGPGGKPTGSVIAAGTFEES